MQRGQGREPLARRRAGPRPRRWPAWCRCRRRPCRCRRGSCPGSAATAARPSAASCARTAVKKSRGTRADEPRPRVALAFQSRWICGHPPVRRGVVGTDRAAARSGSRRPASAAEELVHRGLGLGQRRRGVHPPAGRVVRRHVVRSARPLPLGEIHSNSLGNCMTGASPVPPVGLSIGPHWWNGPRAHDDAVSPASAQSPGNCGSCPNDVELPGGLAGRRRARPAGSRSRTRGCGWSTRRR